MLSVFVHSGNIFFQVFFFMTVIAVVLVIMDIFPYNTSLLALPSLGADLV